MTTRSLTPGQLAELDQKLAVIEQTFLRLVANHERYIADRDTDLPPIAVVAQWLKDNVTHDACAELLGYAIHLASVDLTVADLT